ncbi:MAG TPA: hypothetical protein VF491_17930 [Vicinamibacterales bacterium]
MTLRFAVSLVLGVLASASCGGRTQPTPSYLFVWAGDADGKASDFLAVIDAAPASPRYGSIVASIPTGTAGSHPHHTEPEMPANGHLLANGFHAGRTWLFDLTQPERPQILTAFGDLSGFSHPHTYIRLANGNVLATFQYAAGPDALGAQPTHSHGAAAGAPPSDAQETQTGGLVEMDERGTVIRSRSAGDPAIADSRLYPYSVLPIPAIDRAVLTTTDMDSGHKAATSQWVQFWRLSDLSLLKSIALPPGPRGDEHFFTGEPKLLPDGRSVYVHTFNCGLYLVRDVDQASPAAPFVRSFPGKDCGVPVLTSHYWVQTVPQTHAVVALDITDPEHPREVSTVVFGDDESPHWLAIDPSGRRLVMNSGGSKGNRLYVVNFDPASGALSIDEGFRDAGSTRPGIALNGKTWPHGFSGTPVPHGTVFSR